MQTPEVAQRLAAAWEADPQWTDHMPKVKVTRIKGAFCQPDCVALVAYHPAAVFEAMCDTGNQRIFRNAKGIRNKTVVEDSPEKKVVELEMLASWRFLFLSGEFAVHIRLTQDKPNHKLSFELSRPGFMKKFQGEWTVEPIPVPPSQQLHQQSPPSSAPGEDAPVDLVELALQAAEAEDSEGDVRVEAWSWTRGQSAADSVPWYGKGTRVASKVVMTQQVHPSINPPPFFAHYLKGIAAKSIVEVMCDIQVEAARQRYGILESADVRAELRSRGFNTALLGDTEEVAQGAAKNEGEKKLLPGKKRLGLRDWSVADGKKSLLNRLSKRLSDKDKWKISKSLQEHLSSQCPTVTVAVQ